ncbi:MAG: hypothetical protein ONB44_23745 [candidate division KSB1 bacterium]|nr:hypothetical protein [candidate division KSB1 bacterium]MDZ7305157.1 hypothetical protein [candidate division KSB1 bacterium]MDZ7314241.1 hypothetical protein [candidate division KSB1 bacterium]
MKRKETTIIGGWLVTLLVITICTQPVLAQLSEDVIVTRKTVRVATVRDKPTIKFFVDEYFITEDKIDSIEVIDIVGDGFNEKDMLEVYPSKQLYSLSASDTALAVMRNWKVANSIELVGSKDKKGGQYIIPSSDKPAATAIFAGLMRLLERTYKGKKLSLRFDFDEKEGVAGLQIWGYQEKDLEDIKKPLEQFAADLMFYTRTDTIYVPKPVYDVIYIQQTVTDTVYVSKPSGS